MKRIFLFSAIFCLLAAAASAYEKIEFKFQLQSPAFLKPSAVAVAGGKAFVADSKANAVFVFDAEGKQIKKIEGGLKGPEDALPVDPHETRRRYICPLRTGITTHTRSVGGHGVHGVT